MKKLLILDKTGDTCIGFADTDTEATAKAKVIFDEWMAKKLPAFLTKRQNGKPDEKITDFGQIEEGAETVLVPAIVAG
jgi:hypothetical protein